MCQNRPAGSCFGCSHAGSRRGFLKTCGAAALATLGTRPSRAEPPAAEKIRVAVVFLGNSAGREIWPYPGYDTAARQAEVLRALEQGCPDVAFLPVLVPAPGDLPKALEMKDAVDGFLVHTTTLQWGLTGTLAPIVRLGKPTVIADEFLGGSGVFLVGFAGLRRQGLEAAGVSSTRLEDVVTVARQFAGVKQPGTTPASFARRCEEAYRRTFGAGGPLDCQPDAVQLTEIGRCVERLQQSRFVIVGAGTAGQEQKFLGATGIYIGFDEFRALYDKVDQDEAAEWGRRWATQAEKVVEPTREWIDKAGAVYLAMLDLMKKYDTDSITMNCLGGFGSGQLPAYPCLGFMQLLDDGAQGVCEAMPDDSVSTLMGRILTGRPGYVSDPAIDTSQNQVCYAHCMALTKAFGPQGQANRFRIRTLHNRDPRGCCAQSFLPEGYMTTSFRTNVARKQLVIHQAKAVANLDADRGCRTQLVGQVRGDIEKLFYEWDRFSWHRVTVYGDIQEPLIEFGKALGLEIILEA